MPQFSSVMSKPQKKKNSVEYGVLEVPNRKNLFRKNLYP